MDNSQKRKKRARTARVFRVRKKLVGTQQRPRLSISKTNRHLYVQLIDDSSATTLFGVGTLSKVNQDSDLGKKSKTSARELGKQVAQMAKDRGVDAVVFDRGPNKYHGIIAELAESAREAGLQI